ncbi:hypothetical protein C2G38_2152636 [Gigaspora rosea]|uniref:Uncharacterized protein n=1 Tax=Gigaspora rosea TaxID=44941 RepID=A0A397W711_9GLOM|nr:hypothetical protein C2G38_2152636 [Gigaspora rosea]
MESYGICGVLQYIAPEVIDPNAKSRKPYTKRLILIIIWEILCGMPVTMLYNKFFASCLQEKIVLDKLRPPIFQEIFKPIFKEFLMLNLMKQCWNEELEGVLLQKKL